MNRIIKFYANRSVEEVIFVIILVAGIPYFTINEIIDILTNQNPVIFVINVSLVMSIIYLLRLSLKQKLTKSHIFGFSLVLAVGFAVFWPSSSGLSGPGAYVFQSLMVVLLLVNTGRGKFFFGIFLLIMIYIAGFVHIDYTGKIVYGSQLVSFCLNTLVIVLIMNVFKGSLERERKRLTNRITQLERANDTLETQNAQLEENRKEIIRIQTQLQQIIQERTNEIEKENERMIRYAFINAHLVRAPLANLLGLSELKSSEDKGFKTLNKKLVALDQVVRKIGGVLNQKRNKRHLN